MARTAVILAAGAGTRMRRDGGEARLADAQARVAASGVKALMPVLGRPFLHWVLDDLAELAFERAILVARPEHEDLRVCLDARAGAAPEVEIAVQAEPHGTADALLAAEALVGREPFVMLNSDNYYPSAVLRRLAGCRGNALPAFDREALVAGSNIPLERVARFAILEVDGARLKRLVEKPDPEWVRALSPPVRVSMNCWRFEHEVFAVCRRVRPSSRGELELPQAVADALPGGFEVEAFDTGLPVLDLSRRDDVEGFERLLTTVRELR